jgi:phage-related protein
MKLLDFITPAVKRAYKDFPDEIQDDFGFALFQVQEGKRPSIAKSYSKGIVELRENDDQNRTYRVVYYAHFDECVYVLHAFVKKSTEGIKTSKHDQDIIAEGFKEAKRRHDKYLKNKNSNEH